MSVNFEIDEIKELKKFKDKIILFINKTESVLLEREELVRLIVISLFANENLFMYGPPGSAKSLAATALKLATEGSRFFRYLMTDFTKYEEIFGKEISSGKGTLSKRVLEGKLPTADYAFIDEIFKANAEILNSMLTILNERQFDDDYNGTIDVPLKMTIAASNEFPRTTYLKALFERFPLRIPVPNIKDKENRKKLFNGDIKALKELPIFKWEEISYVQERYKKIRFDDEMSDLLNFIIDSLHNLMNPENDSKEIESIYEISGRTSAKIGSIIRLSAYLNCRNKVDVSDLLLLRYMAWSNLQERNRVLPKINQLIFGGESEYHGDTVKELENWSGFVIRFVRNLKPLIDGIKKIENESEFNTFMSNLNSFNNEFQNSVIRIKTIKEKLELCDKKEKLVEDNIFLSANNVLEWKVRESYLNVNSTKFNELIKIIDDYNSLIKNDKFKLWELITKTISIHEIISSGVIDWLNNNDSFIIYKINY